jgi:hypothetical protein
VGAKRAPRDYGPAVLAIAAAVLGALAGGWATYLGNRSLQHGQSEAAARGTARVLSSQFEQTYSRLVYMLRERRLTPANSSVPVIELSIEDQKLLASNLTPGQWVAVAEAIAEIRRETSADSIDTRRALAGFDVPLALDDAAQVKRIAGSVRDGMVALQPLASGG